MSSSVFGNCGVFEIFTEKPAIFPLNFLEDTATVYSVPGLRKQFSLGGRLVFLFKGLNLHYFDGINFMINFIRVPAGAYLIFVISSLTSIVHCVEFLY